MMTIRTLNLLALILSITASSLLLAVVETAHAELTECNGVWTNKPCASSVAEKLTESHPTPRPQQEIDLDRKKLLVHDLEMKQLTARDQYKLEIGIATEKSLCISAETSIADCEIAVQKKLTYLDDRMLAAAKLGNEKKGDPKAEQNSSSSSQPTEVTIIQNQDFNERWRRRHERTPIPSHRERPIGPPGAHEGPDWDHPNRPRDPYAPRDNEDR